ncbi:MAG: hypothetical protein ACTSWN_01760, partial [Promethearchaeota archaeon]
LRVKWDSDGNQVWNKTWGGSSYDYGYSVWGDGSYLYTCGSTTGYIGSARALVLVKWDLDGNQIWYRIWFGPDSGFVSLAKGESVWGDGNYIYTSGYMERYGAGNEDLLLVKWDTNGNQVWYRTCGGSDWDYGYSVWGDGSYLYTCGYTHSFGAGWNDLLLVKWDTTMIDLMESDVDGGGSSDDDSSTTNTAIPGYDPILIILALTVELMITVFVLMILKNRGFKIKI